MSSLRPMSTPHGSNQARAHRFGSPSGVLSRGFRSRKSSSILLNQNDGEGFTVQDEVALTGTVSELIGRHLIRKSAGHRFRKFTLSFYERVVEHAYTRLIHRRLWRGGTKDRCNLAMLLVETIIAALVLVNDPTPVKGAGAAVCVLTMSLALLRRTSTRYERYAFFALHMVGSAGMLCRTPYLWAHHFITALPNFALFGQLFLAGTLYLFPVFATAINVATLWLFSNTREMEEQSAFIPTVLPWCCVLLVLLSQRMFEFMSRRRFSLVLDTEDNKQGQLRLLHNFVPPWVAARLRKNQRALRRFDKALVLFVVIDRFDEVAENTVGGHQRFFKLLNALTQRMDRLTGAQKKLYKVENILGDYVVCSKVVTDPEWMGGWSGAPSPQGIGGNRLNEELTQALHLAVAMVELANDFSKNNREDLGVPIKFRIGLAFGEVIAGVVGSSRTFFRIFGDTVNTASRMQKVGATGRVCMTSTVADVVSRALSFTVEDRGTTRVKGKGVMNTFFLGIEEHVRMGGMRATLAKRAGEDARADKLGRRATRDQEVQKLLRSHEERENSLRRSRQKAQSVMERRMSHSRQRRHSSIFGSFRQRGMLRDAGHHRGPSLRWSSAETKRRQREWSFRRRAACTRNTLALYLLAVLVAMTALELSPSLNPGGAATAWRTAALAASAALVAASLALITAGKLRDVIFLVVSAAGLIPGYLAISVAFALYPLADVLLFFSFMLSYLPNFLLPRQDAQLVVWVSSTLHFVVAIAGYAMVPQEELEVRHLAWHQAVAHGLLTLCAALQVGTASPLNARTPPATRSPRHPPFARGAPIARARGGGPAPHRVSRGVLACTGLRRLERGAAARVRSARGRQRGGEGERDDARGAVERRRAREAQEPRSRGVGWVLRRGARRSLLLLLAEAPRTEGLEGRAEELQGGDLREGVQNLLQEAPRGAAPRVLAPSAQLAQREPDSAHGI